MKYGFVFLFLLLLIPLALAYDFDDKPSDDEKEMFDEFLEPIMRIYRFIKYVATVIGVLVVTISGITAMASGHDPIKRNKAKEIVGYALLGILIIWLAPILIEIVLG